MKHHIYDNLIKKARLIRSVSFTIRATIVGGCVAVAIYEQSNAKEASNLVKEFCYKEAGQRNFEIKMDNAPSTSLSISSNTLYIPNNYNRSQEETLEYALEKEIELQKVQQYNDDYFGDNGLWYQQKQIVESKIIQKIKDIEQLKIDYTFFIPKEPKKLVKLIKKLDEELDYLLENKRELDQLWRENLRNIVKIEDNNRRINLYRGILDHEMGHLKHHDSYRGLFFFLSSFIGMEYLWGVIRPNLELQFKKSVLKPSSTKNIALIGILWCAKLVVPTVCYTGTFFAVRQLTKRTIEAQADANVREDLDVLIQMEYFFRKLANRQEELENFNFLLKFISVIAGLSSSHPSHKNRADYFAKRIKNFGRPDEKPYAMVGFFNSRPSHKNFTSDFTKKIENFDNLDENLNYSNNSERQRSRF